jgi:hypothetical protein
VLQNEGLVGDPKEMAVLCKFYEVAGVPDKVNYGRFLTDTDTPPPVGPPAL